MIKTAKLLSRNYRFKLKLHVKKGQIDQEKLQTITFAFNNIANTILYLSCVCVCVCMSVHASVCVIVYPCLDTVCHGRFETVIFFFVSNIPPPFL